MKPILKSIQEYISLWQGLLAQQRAEYQEATTPSARARWEKRIAETERIISKLEAKARQAERKADGTGAT